MPRVFERYKWLCDLISNNRGITLREIQHAWDNSALNDDSKTLARRTFCRHIEEIESEFGIRIRCNKSDNSYYIDNDAEDSGFQQWMLGAMAVENMIRESKDLSDRIRFEAVPGGLKHLSTIISAMRQNRQLCMNYTSFRSSSEEDTFIKPFFLRVFQQRWYVIGPSSKHGDSIRTFALDRINSLEISALKFSSKEVPDMDEYYAYCFGIFREDSSKAEFIRLKVSKRQSLYLDTLPIHPSQKKLESKDDYTYYELYLAPGLDFRQFLVSKGSQIEVLEPQHLRDEIIAELKLMAENYKY